VIYLLEKVRKTIEVNNLLQKDDKILVALSGGCDSVCLCLALKKLGFNVSAAHLNHSIREEADSDEAFVKDFAQRHSLKIFIKKADIPKIAIDEKISLESAGRKERYKFFEEICAEYGCTKIAVAHNKNDNAETFLMNLMRGSGLKGLCSIPIKRGKVIRPLIEITRGEIEEFVLENGETFVTDKTNFSNDYTRNKIRNVLIPQFLEISDNFIDSVYKTTSLLKDDYDYISTNAGGLVKFEDSKAFILKEELLKYPSSVVSLALIKAYEFVAGTSKDFEKKHIDYISEKIKTETHGNIIDLCFGVRCCLRYGKVVFEKRAENREYEYTLKSGETCFVKEAGIKFSFKEVDSSGKFEFAENRQYFAFDGGEIKVRSRHKGDKIIPFGSDKETKLKKILIDQKIDVTKRDSLPIIEYNGDIIWVYECCRSALYKLKDTHVKIFEIQGEKIDEIS